MRRALLALLLCLGVACGEAEPPGDSEECRRWQSRYELAETFSDDTRALIQSELLTRRPEGCEIP